ncbi:XshC-Cox1-family protein [Muricauda sp. JGD-17]|uniref:XshC-Cox1-family protein n=1 Tax=Flagellimonas ochracea TaxID=2696472 RepID=A0A964T9X7_9FLAO|nr:XdhC/CoxI family protein [Allomuricauda ochracea]NAY90950.1 XshC-Cox1-family protein [Allomuricauda ochracea]
MTHEIKTIFEEYKKKKDTEAAVLATVVALDGSSYRRPGVRMLIFESGTMVGAVSGGCVEKEVVRQAQYVFSTGVSRMMIYDGRYRLGCEGILYILLETFKPDETLLTAFSQFLEQRKSFSIRSYYTKEQGDHRAYQSIFTLGNKDYPVSSQKKYVSEDLFTFEQKLQPCFQLIIIGAEHDAVQLCRYASLTGWEVTVVANIKEGKSKTDFPGVHQLLQVDPEQFQPKVDDQTAVVIMTHSYVKDLQYLIALKDIKVAYIGLLGPYKRREKLFDELLERCPELTEDLLDLIHGPAGIDIGAETPQEIALSILSEILTVRNKREPMLLREKMSKIHS